jgi:hypothetical protein
VNQPRACLLGCKTPDGYARRAAPGLNVCPPCSEKLRGVLDALERTYAAVTELDELIPGGHGPSDGGRRVPGSRSPANDGVLVHTDPRSTVLPGASPAALATIVGYARLVRDERTVDVAPRLMRGTVPTGRATMRRECATLRFNWDWIMGQPWVDQFATDLGAVLHGLKTLQGGQTRVVRIGTCPVALVALTLPDATMVTLDCGASLRVKVSDSEIRCRNCGTTWLRAQWHQLGDPWTDYAYLATELDVNASTLRYWCREDRWQAIRMGGRTVVARADALASYTRRRPGNTTIDQAG